MVPKKLLAIWVEPHVTMFTYLGSSLPMYPNIII